MLGNLRANLCGIAVDSLAASDDQIIFQVTDRSGQCLGGSPGIRTAEYSVSYENTIICAHSHSLAQNFFCLGKTHCDYGNFSAVFVLQSQCGLQTCLIIRVHDCKHSTSVQRTIGIEFNAALCIRYLLNTNNNFHCIPLLVFLYSLNLSGVISTVHRRLPFSELRLFLHRSR